MTRPEPHDPNDRPDDEPAAGERPPSERPKLTRRDAWQLVLATYKASFPYLLIFVILMLAATWFVTTVLFR